MMPATAAITILAAVLLLYGCATAPAPESAAVTSAAVTSAAAPAEAKPTSVDEAYLNGNRIVFAQSSLSFPPDWTVHKPLDDDEQGMLFRFHDSDGSIRGAFEYVAFDFEIDPQKLTDYYLNSVLAFHADTQVHSMEIDGKQSTVIRARHQETGSDVLIALICEGKNVNVIELIGAENTLSADPEAGHRIFASYRYMPQDTDIRISRDVLGFYCYDGQWSWYDEVDRGFYMSGELEGRLCVIGIWQVEQDSTEVFARENVDFNIPLFDAHFFVNNAKIYTKGAGTRAEDGLLSLYYIVPYQNRNYCIYVSTKNPDLDPAQAHLHETIVDLFRFNLSFGG